MQICTLVLTSGGSLPSFTIAKNDNVVKFDFCVNTGSTAQMLGDQTVGGQNSMAQSFLAGEIYNSPFSGGSNTWSGVTVTCTSGTVKLVLYRN